MSIPDIKLPDITWITPTWTPNAHIQSVGRVLRPAMSLQDIYERLAEYLLTGRVMEWNRVRGDVRQAALSLLETHDAKLVRVDGIDYLARKRPNPLVQILTIGLRK